MTYLGLSALFVAAAVLVAGVLLLRRPPDRAWWVATGVTAAALMALTIVFDSLMIAADLFRYDEDQLSGVRLWLTPVEDLAWPLAAVAALPALWRFLGRRDHP